MKQVPIKFWSTIHWIVFKWPPYPPHDKFPPQAKTCALWLSTWMGQRKECKRGTWTVNTINSVFDWWQILPLLALLMSPTLKHPTRLCLQCWVFGWLRLTFGTFFAPSPLCSLGAAPRDGVVVHGTGGEVKYTLEQLLTAVKAFLQSAPASSAFPHLPCCCWHPCCCCCCCCSLNINPPQILMLSKLNWGQHGRIKAVVGFAQNANSLLIWVEWVPAALFSCDAIMKHPENMPRGVVGVVSLSS